jgi:uncharacterized protein (DUF2252 family)
MGRMAASPFAFLRGSACVMASDLSRTPISGIPVVIDGDAHLNNFGMYGTPQREVVFDLNDFDEAVIGPWEWDLKRLTASVNVAGRQNGLNRSERAAAVRQCVKGYRFNARRLQEMGVLDIWYLHAYPGKENPIVKADPKSKAVFRKTLAKAMHTDNRALMPKVADRKSNGKWTFRDDPPVLTRVDKATKQKVIDALNRYSRTPPDAGPLPRCGRCAPGCRSWFRRDPCLPGAAIRKWRGRPSVSAGQRGADPRARAFSAHGVG